MEASNKKSYSKEELEEFRVLIEKKIDEAQKNLELLRSLYRNDKGNGTDDTASSFKSFDEGSKTLSKEFNMQMAIREEKYIRDLKNALTRINNNTYGICRVSGELIPKDRLRIVPHATLTVQAKENRR